MIFLFAIGIIITLIMGIYIYQTYNQIIYFLEEVVKNASNLEAVLKRKYDMIPSLIEIVKGYAKHESSTFTEVTKLRSQWGKSKDLDKKIKTANQLESFLSKLLVIKENYPDLKANRTFKTIMNNIYTMEEEILDQRKKYNEVVKMYNLKVKIFPTNIVAKIFGFMEKTYFSVNVKE